MFRKMKPTFRKAARFVKMFFEVEYAYRFR